MGTEFPWRWGRGAIFANLDVIWGMSVKVCVQAPIFLSGPAKYQKSLYQLLDEIGGELIRAYKIVI